LQLAVLFSILLDVRIIREGARGADVHDIQRRLVAAGYQIDPAEFDGLYGPSTEKAVRRFQSARSIGCDGIVGPETWDHLVETGYRIGDRTLYLRFPYFRGDDVRELQRKLNALGFDASREDGIFGERTDRAAREFQLNTGAEADGIVGPDTFEAFGRLRPDPEAASRAIVREAASLREGRSLIGAVIAIDGGHGMADPGAAGPGGSEEADIAFTLAEELAEELARRGAQPLLLRTRHEDPTASERAKAANASGAVACLSMHMNSGEAGERGSTCTYFGTDRTHSPAGMRLARLIQEELGTRMGLLDRGTKPMAITLLRETKMPAVQVEPCFITSPEEELFLQEPGFVHDIAVAVGIAVERFLEPVKDA
jgi:N-acetylmuramoyl-L-alanine amidase